MIGLLRQNLPSMEVTTTYQVALMEGYERRTCSIDDVFSHQEALLQGKVMPVGSVEFVRKCMNLLYIEDPEPFDYPLALDSYLKRDVRISTMSEFTSEKPMFIKPFWTKRFNSLMKIGEFGLKTIDSLGVSCNEPIWVCEPVNFTTEVRYYVMNQKIIGMGRYDDLDESAPMPDIEVVEAAIKDYERTLPYCIDFGVLENGETALVECNDAWAIGYYKGTLSPRQYYEFLAVRWQSLLASSQLIQKTSQPVAL